MNFDDLIPTQGASGAGPAHFGTVDDANDGVNSRNIELASNLKNQCIDECHPILNRPPAFRGSNKNEFDFYKCLNEHETELAAIKSQADADA